MKILLFQARSFRWKSFQKTLADAVDQDVDVRVDEALVAFVHAEVRDQTDDGRARVFRHALKQIKWLANKRTMKNVVLHSFAHLGGENSEPLFAKAFLEELGERLHTTGYAVSITPFGYTCEWDLSVYGESIAKVWQEI
jgi:hypothetical protein